MKFEMAGRSIFALFLSLTFALQVAAQTGASPSISTPPPTSTSSNATGTTSRGSSATDGSIPDVYLNVPTLGVERIELTVEDLQADINLNAKVANLVQLNAGVQVGIKKVNITIADVEAELELVVRLGNLVDIVNRVFESLDLNPLLINTLNNVTDILDDVVGAVDGLLGSITQGGKTLSFLVDNLGNIVQEVDGASSIVGNYLQNMTLVDGSVKQLGNGLTQKTFSYSPLSSLVDIVFNTAGNIVQAVVQKTGSGGGGGGSGSGGSSSSSTVTSAAAVTSSTST